MLFGITPATYKFSVVKSANFVPKTEFQECIHTPSLSMISPFLLTESLISKKTRESGVTCYVLRVTCYVLRVTCYVLRVTCYGLRVTGYGLRVTGYGLRVTCYGLMVNG